MSSLATNAITDASGGNTATINSYTPTESNMAGRNRIINGGMVLDQRNAGAEVNPAVNATYYLDRWVVNQLVSGKFKIGQNAGSVTPPAGFKNYVGCTSLSAYSVGAGEYLGVSQKIEGFNVADLDWGTANAKTVTLSFQVYSSLTGTFSGSILNSASNRSYIFSYSISSANTWTTISVTISGDTTGTWLTTNGTGIEVYFNLGSGSGYSTTAGIWQGLGYRGVTGGVSVVGTSGATFYITGVQLEEGSVATPFERRQYGQELALCQRYCWVSYTTSGNGGPLGTGAVYNATLTQVALNLPVSMRTTPSATTVANGSSVWCTSYVGASGTSTNTAPSIQADQNNYQNLRLAIDGLSGMTAGQASWTFTSANAKLILSAEL